MPRRPKGAYKYLRHRKGRAPVWVIRDGPEESSTGCGAQDIRGAEEALSRHIARKHKPDLGQRDPSRLLIADILNGYAQAKGESPSAELIGYHLVPLIAFWGEKTLDDVKSATCQDYVRERTAQRIKAAKKVETYVSAGTARRELETLSAAIGWYHAQYTLSAVPVVTLPEKAPARHQWFTRKQVAGMLRDAKKQGSRHLMRFILIGVYTGSRPGTITKLRWIRSSDGGSFDLDRGTFERRGFDEIETNKRRPPARIPARLLAHLRRWHHLDRHSPEEEKKRKPSCAKKRAPRRPITHVIHIDGHPVAKLRKAFARTCERLGFSDGETPHVLRHTCITWAMQNRADPWELSGFAGMSLKVLLEVYGHHHPDHQQSVSDAFTRNVSGAKQGPGQNKKSLSD